MEKWLSNSQKIRTIMNFYHWFLIDCASELELFLFNLYGILN